MEVLAADEARAWLLTRDAGQPLLDLPDVAGQVARWEEILPRYAELQRGEIPRAADHLAKGVPDLRIHALPAAWSAVVDGDLPIEPDETDRLRAFGPGFAELVAEVAAEQPGETIQHDDLHPRSVFLRGDALRVLDWGDASIGHPFFSLVVTFRFLELWNGLAPDDPALDRLRDAYLEPWGGAPLRAAFARALRLGRFVHAAALVRHRVRLVGAPREEFDRHYAVTLRRAIAAIHTPGGPGARPRNSN